MKRLAVVAIVTALAASVGGIGFAASLTLNSQKLAATAVATPIMFPDSVNTVDAGGHVGKMEKNDTITFVWSRVIDETTLCSGWSNAQSTHTTNITWLIQNNAGATGNDVLTPSTTATCTGGLHVGSVDLGAAGYVANNGSIGNAPTTVTVGTTTTSLTMKFPGAPTGSPGTVTSGTAGVWTPNSAVTDFSGNNCGSNLAMTGETVLF